MAGCAVFDLDGTLVDSAPLFARILTAMLADRGMERVLTAAQTRPHVNAGGRAMLAALLGDQGGDVDLAVAEFRARYAALPTPEDSLYPGAREALTVLDRHGVTLALFSNKPQHLCEKVIDELGLASLFRAVVGTGPGVPLKPDPAGLDLALAGSGVGRSGSCYVGDTEADAALARVAGVPLVMAAWGYGEAGCGSPDARIARSFDAVPHLVIACLAGQGVA